MSAIIKDENRITPFMFQGCEIVAVSADCFSHGHPPVFQLCGKVWGDGAYPKEMLVEAGANAEELDRVYASDKAAHELFKAQLA